MPRHTIAASAAVIAAIFAGAARAQDATNESVWERGMSGQDEIVVTGTRFAAPVSELPISITVIDADEIQTNPVFGANIQNGLSQLIPGGTINEVGSSDIVVRGRGVSYRVNGVELNQRGRASDIAVQDLEPSSFGQIEVVRGTDAAFGFGFNGGSLSFATRGPTDGAPEFETTLGIDFQPTDAGDSLGWRFRQDVSGTTGRLGYYIGASGRFTGNQFDPDGNVFPDTNSNFRTASDVFAFDGTLIFALTDNQEVETKQYYYTAENEPEFRAVAGDFLEGVFASAEPIPGDAFDASSDAYNYLGTFAYRHKDFFGGKLQITGFIQDGSGTFSTDNPGRTVGTRDEGNNRYGVQSSIETPLSFLNGTLFEGAAIVYGVDYQNYEYFRTQIEGPLGQDGVPFPGVEEETFAGHGQARIPIGEDFVLTGGFRIERGSYILEDAPVRVGRAPFEGGEIDFEVNLFNGALLYNIDENWATYFAFSQSAGVLDVGRGSRNVARAVDLDPNLDPTNQYEVGFRANYDNLAVTLAAFYSASDLGQSFIPAEPGTPATVVPAPVEIWGGEFTLDARLTDNLNVGGTASFSDGREEPTGVEVEIVHTQIQPFKLTGYVDYSPASWWRNRLTATHQIGSDTQTDRLTEDLNGGNALDPITFINYFASFSPEFLPGSIDVGVENLFNRDEVDIVAQSLASDGLFYRYPGRRIRIDYRIEW